MGLEHILEEFASFIE